MATEADLFAALGLTGVKPSATRSPSLFASSTEEGTLSANMQAVHLRRAQGSAQAAAKKYRSDGKFEAQPAVSQNSPGQRMDSDCDSRRGAAAAAAASGLKDSNPASIARSSSGTACSLAEASDPLWEAGLLHSSPSLAAASRQLHGSRPGESGRQKEQPLPAKPPSIFTLFAGEMLELPPIYAKHLPSAAVSGVGWLAPPHPGTLFMTNLRLLWEPCSDPPVHTDEAPAPVSVPIFSIERLHKRKLTSVASADAEVLLELLQKYGARSSLSVLVAASHEQQLSAHVHYYLETPTRAEQPRANVNKSFAVLHASVAARDQALVPSQQRSATARCYDPEVEFHRQGLNNPLSHWRITRLNENYELCSTYPALLVVPRAVSDDDVVRAAAFRSGRRLPVLCWKDAYGVASICRSSQPMVGMPKSRSAHDEDLLQAIVDTNPFGEQLQIIDCRPRVNAQLNHAKGKGYEHAAEYKNTNLLFMGIENIHVMRTSLRAFLSLLGGRSGEAKEGALLFAELDKSGWMEHVKTVLQAAALVARMVHVQRASVLVHCSDGWDRTPQVTALAQLLLDPTFRSKQGFEGLIEKEWLAFGHQFALRVGTIAPLDRGRHASPTDEQHSPVFLQFVDCVWQLTEQFPRAFEFNASYLATLLHHVYSCQFGTFLANSESQRVRLGLERAASVWQELEGSQYTNYNYVPTQQVLTPELSLSALRPWTAFYCRGADVLRPEPLSLAERRCAALADELTALRAQMRAPPPSSADGYAADSDSRGANRSATGSAQRQPAKAGTASETSLSGEACAKDESTHQVAGVEDSCCANAGATHDMSPAAASLPPASSAPAPSSVATEGLATPAVLPKGTAPSTASPSRRPPPPPPPPNAQPPPSLASSEAASCVAHCSSPQPSSNFDGEGRDRADSEGLPACAGSPPVEVSFLQAEGSFEESEEMAFVESVERQTSADELSLGAQ